MAESVELFTKRPTTPPQESMELELLVGRQRVADALEILAACDVDRLSNFRMAGSAFVLRFTIAGEKHERTIKWLSGEFAGRSVMLVIKNVDDLNASTHGL